jgi:hypothetical protein
MVLQNVNVFFVYRKYIEKDKRPKYVKKGVVRFESSLKPLGPIGTKLDWNVH